jgi:hypothetical protein
VALAPQPTPIAARATGSTSATAPSRAVAGGQLGGANVDTTTTAPPKNGAGSGTASGTNAPPRNGHVVVDNSERKLTFLVALPAILLLLPLFVLPFIGRRRYY